MKRPIGITILGTLYILGGLGMMILAIILGILSSSLVDGLVKNPIFIFFGSIELFLATTLFAIILGIVATIQFIIASALFSGKNRGRTIVIIFTISDLIFEIISLFVGNVFGIPFLVLDSIVLYYMWRPHVLAYFNGINVQPSQQSYNSGFPQNPPPYTPPNQYTPANQYNSGFPQNPTPYTPPNQYTPGDETQIYPDEPDVVINTPPQKICQKCQTEISPTAKFCHKCGNWI